ncbi:MAG: histidinol-phosphate transaminase [Lachnospiraceae bacterium]|nr:histidinol-phosphate transaminase [Lachnospiraceae bacterium]
MSRFFSERLTGLVPYTPGEQPQNRQYIKLNTNESPFPPSPLAQRLARQEAGSLQLYSDPEVEPLVEIGAEKFGVEKDEILFSNSSDEMLNFAFITFCDDTHPAVFPDVTYGFYPVFAELNHIAYEEIPVMEDLSIRVSDYIGINKTIFIANPNAPTGIALPLTAIEEIVKSNPDNIVVIDEAYVDFGAESCKPLIHKYDNLLVVQTFSKSRSMAGARLGFAFGNKDLIADLKTIKYSTNPYNVNRMTMCAGIGALADEKYFKDNCQKIIETRAFTEKELARLGFTMTDSKANFLFAKNETIGGRELYLKLKEEKGILIRHFDKDKLRDYVRITVGSMEQMEALIKALEEILQ